MQRFDKRFKYFLRSFFLAYCTLLSALCYAANYPKPQGYVSDFANILDAGSRQSLETGRCSASARFSRC